MEACLIFFQIAKIVFFHGDVTCDSGHFLLVDSF